MTAVTAQTQTDSHLVELVRSTPSRVNTVDESASAVEKVAAGVFSVYFAGGLFDSRQLHGNAALAVAIEKLSAGKYAVTLPQNVEIREFDPHQIRDDDFDNVLKCDFYLGQFDGTELDSGTVAEFMRATSANIPALLMRTDFRNGGDQGPDKAPWNLMLSAYPRCEILCINAMESYKKELGQGATAEESLRASAAAIDTIAKQIILKLDILSETKPILPREIQEAVYRGIALTTGFKKGPAAAEAFALAVLHEKQSKGLL